MTSIGDKNMAYTLFSGMEKALESQRQKERGKERFRNEWKYMISWGEKEFMERRMEPWMQLDRHAKNGGYTIRSLYFDDYWNSAFE